MGRLRVILGDQLSQSISCLTGCDKTRDTILMCEVWDEATYVAHHKKKIAFLFSAMRHFARDLRKTGYNIDYIQLDDAENSGSFRGEVNRAIARHAPEQIIVTHPGEYRVLQDMKTWQKAFALPVEIRDDDRFLCGLDEFRDWAKDRTQLRMEFFYREMRKKHGILLENGKPVGGQWNFDTQNRKPPKNDMDIPAPYQSRPDDITNDVLDLVAARFGSHFGDLQPFHFAVTRQQALNALDQFINQRLAQFGDYQDAMVQNQPWMFHAHLAFYLNCGLLLPLECIKAAENAYYRGDVPLNAAEGFIRQILGWREFVRGIYWLRMPGYGDENYFEATAALPEFYWTAQTKMNCLRQCVLETRKNAYAHHIQRLMVLGNFALLAGISPRDVNEWFLIVYADAFEWVEMPNVSGMILFADGGYLASKPYAAGGGYISKMSNYCDNCSYKVSKKNGPDACPFNYLYWDFLARNRTKLADNHRVGMMYKTYDRMGDDKKQAIADDANRFLKSLS
ncbi:cryptochrome/photolyase family protein [Thalassospira sp. MCCC 1A01428]|uniref:cryptochrome/photolyase family protein n=1 Tax=Thalassospira sp. MCCC 1A01428 TaxID=1470575 RepID=UPI000A1DDDD7|nr:cryptochrome/photolyase family protein [Thalassospira sp. MCCC 1A01428]OSQ34770.1 deoxyribodipyrimidine photolyase [Thalassospira sp. MCCC 1A01428]